MLHKEIQSTDSADETILGKASTIPRTSHIPRDEKISEILLHRRDVRRHIGKRTETLALQEVMELRRASNAIVTDC
jgi:hypothetical protein